MSLETLFSACGAAVLPGWLLLVFAPRWKWTLRLIAPVLIPALLAVIYAFLLARYWGEGEGGFGSLAGVASLFEHPGLLLAGWLHYLAFDLFVGSWEVRDSMAAGVPHWMVVPCLALTFLFGPVGLILYLALRAVKTKSVLIGSVS